MDPILLRRHLHANPELSFREYGTARFIAEQLTAQGIACRTVAGTGVLARIDGNANPLQAIVLRADIDALPVTEQADVEWRSQNIGVMHACGHDMHAAALFATLCKIKQCGGLATTVFGLFQPGEECNPGGAQAVLAEKPFDGYEVRAVIGAHVEAGMAVGTFGFCEGVFMSSNDELRFTVNGRGGHAAMRNTLTDPVVAAAELIVALSALNSGDCVLSLGRVTADGATNVIPDKVSIEGTMRTFDEGVRRNIKQSIAEAAAGVDAAHGTRTIADISEGYPCVVNDPALTEMAYGLAAERFRAVRLPRRATSEDFGRYAERYPALFYRFGVGQNSGNTHTAHFCPDERALDCAAEFMFSLAEKIAQYTK